MWCKKTIYEILLSKEEAAVPRLLAKTGDFTAALSYATVSFTLRASYLELSSYELTLMGHRDKIKKTMY